MSTNRLAHLRFVNGNTETSSKMRLQARYPTDQGEFTLKESALASYRDTTQKLVKLFLNIQFEHVP